jgi:CRP-like cAMP-binding protein
VRTDDTTRVRRMLARSAHMAQLPPAVLDRLASMSHLRRARHGESLATSPHAHQLFMVVSGAVRISTHPVPRNGECVHAVLGAGSYFGLPNAVGVGSYTYRAQAFGPTDLAVVDGKRLAAVLDHYPRLWRRVSRLLARRLKLIIDTVADNAVLPLRQRVVRRLVSHATSMQLSDDSRPTVLMTQGDLGRMVGSGRAKVNAVLKDLEAHGLVRVGYRTVTLLDLPAMRKLAGREVEPL